MESQGRQLVHENRGQAGAERAIVEGNRLFALDLYRELKGEQGNLFFSPYSISAALAMTYAGAPGNTARQMARTLHLTADPDQLHPAFAALEESLAGLQVVGGVELSVANSLWPQVGYPFLREYLALVREHYGVSITPLDYATAAEAARARINDWVAAKTEDRIQDLIPPRLLNALTLLVLVNAIYFKGDWASQFDPAHTAQAPFWVTHDKEASVPMMAQKSEFGYAEWDGLQVLELAYVGHELSLVVFLPTESDGLEQLELALTVENLDRWTVNLRQREVQVYLPRFKMAAQFKLRRTLTLMGMIDAFGRMANFTGMDGGLGGLFISEVIHKAFVEVSEEGSEAAAATAVIMSRGLPMPAPSFRADHPFLFLIRQKSTGSILFLGRLADPLASTD